MTPGLPRTECDPVLAGVKAKPFGWPTASLDPDSGRRPNAASGSPAARTKQNQVSTVSGDCHYRTRAHRAGPPPTAPETTK